MIEKLDTLIHRLVHPIPPLLQCGKSKTMFFRHFAIKSIVAGRLVDFFVNHYVINVYFACYTKLKNRKGIRNITI